METLGIERRRAGGAGAASPAIALSGLRRDYGEAVALREVSVELATGETLVVLGPNGAGKTTLLRILAGLLRPTAGAVEVLGCALPREAWRLRGRLGFLGHEPLLYRELTGAENLRFHARLLGLEADGEERIEGLLELVGLRARAGDRVAELSAGTVQRLAVCRAVLHEPELLLLDEPLSHLDPGLVEALGPLIGAAPGRSRVLVTHDVERGLQEADRVLALRRDGSPGYAGPAGSVDEAELRRIYTEPPPGHGGPVRHVSPPSTPDPAGHAPPPAPRPGASDRTAALTILAKDLRVELRTLQSVPAMVLFAVTTFVIFRFALDRTSLDGSLAAGVLLVTVLFAAILAINRLFVAEREQGGFEAIRLAPVDGTALFLAKAASLVVYLAVLELVAVPIFAVFFLDSAAGLAPLVGVLVLLDLGLAATGTLISTMATNSRARDLLTPLILLPLLVPLMIAAAGAAEPLLAVDGPSQEDLGSWMAVLALYDLIFLLVGYAVFDFLLED